MWWKIFFLILICVSCSESPKQDFDQSIIQERKGLILDADSVLFTDGSMYFAEVIQFSDTANCPMLTDDYSCKVQILRITSKDNSGKRKLVLESDTVIMNELKGLYGGFQGIKFDTTGNDLKIAIHHYTHTGGNYEVFDHKEYYSVLEDLSLKKEDFSFRAKVYDSDSTWYDNVSLYIFHRDSNKIEYHSYLSGHWHGIMKDTTYTLKANKHQLELILQPYNQGAFID
jgi:hypothetical protein